MDLRYSNALTCDEYIKVIYISEIATLQRRVGEPPCDLYCHWNTYDEPRFVRNKTEIKKLKSGWAGIGIRILQDKEAVTKYLLGVDLTKYAKKTVNGCWSVNKVIIDKIMIDGGFKDRTLF